MALTTSNNTAPEPVFIQAVSDHAQIPEKTEFEAKGGQDAKQVPVQALVAGGKPVKVEFIVGIDSMREDQEGLHIAGILSIPRVSLNGWIYMPDELEKQGGKTVPMFFEHQEMFDPSALPIGAMMTFWNPNMLQLEYEATVTNREKIDAIKHGQFKHVSMAATWEDFDMIRGWLFPKGVEIIEGSLVAEPGIPETTVSIIDYVNNLYGKPIPTQKCDAGWCRSIMGDSHRPGEQSPGCKSMNEKGKDKENETNTTETAALNSEGANNTNEDEAQIHVDSDGAPPAGKGDEKRKVIILDAKGMESLLEANTRLAVDAIKEVMSPVQKALDGLPKPQPTARVSDRTQLKEGRDKFYRIVADSLRKFQKLDWGYIAERLRADGIGMDAIGLTEVGTAAGAQWLEDITIIPSGLSTALRNTCEVVIIERGAKEAHFTLIATPAPGDGSPPTVPSDVTQAITDVLATPAERVLKQRVTDQAMRATSVNLGSAIATTFRNAEVLDEDDKILTELNGLTVGNLAGDFFGGNATSEATIDSADTFDHKLLAKAKRAMYPKVGVSDIVTVAVKKGTAAMKKKVLTAVIVRQRQSIRRPNGMRIAFEDNACVIIDDQGLPVGTEIKGVIAREVATRFPKVAAIAAGVV